MTIYIVNLYRFYRHTVSYSEMVYCLNLRVFVIGIDVQFILHFEISHQS